MKVLIFVAFLLGAVAAVPPPPKFPSAYHADILLELPYANLQMMMHVDNDTPNKRMNIQYFEEMNSELYLPDDTFTINVMKDKRVCRHVKGSNTPLVFIPDLSTWSYLGQKMVDGTNCTQYERFEKDGESTNHYIFSFEVGSLYNVPVHLSMKYGINFIFGSHKDQYEFFYSTFVPRVNNTAFNVPTLCNNPIKTVVRPVSAARTAFAPLVETVRNMKLISEHNAQPDASYKMGPNHFGHLSTEEIADMYRLKKGRFTPATTAAYTFSSDMVDSVPESINWNQLGAVTPVKDQGVCGSCWAFSSIGTLEGRYFTKYGHLHAFSEQLLVDCAWTMDGPNVFSNYYSNNGCDGGQPYLAMEWMQSAGGAVFEENYPYKMLDNYCNPPKIEPIVSGYVNITSGDEEALKAAVAQGPVSVAINVPESLLFYTEGVYEEEQCKNTFFDLEHGVLVVGYGTDAATGKDYWLVKNSWSTHWGDNGYIKMRRNHNNMCGIATAAVFPIVA
eukprot:GCRY01000163.1.p1 GENE.GCRY01000163.1~~GCRY01000163.1.p1  ORF type:complete len:520 (+),score=134.30 GCRY01000163.1:56-1561(+)